MRYLVAPGVLAAPPWIVNQLLDSSPVSKWLRSEFPDLAGLLQRYDVLFYLAAGAYSALLIAFAKAIAKRVESRSLDLAGVLTLEAAIDNVVGCKLERFEKHANGGAKITRDNVFATITQPSLQIAEITRGVAEYFNACRPAKKRQHLIRVLLAEIQNGKISEFVVSFPKDEPVRLTRAELNRSNSAIMTAVRSRRIVVIDSIEKELRKGRNACYVPGGNTDDATGSIICYPVMGAARLPVFVISIHCEEDRYFSRSKADLYAHVLSRFALRLNLEYNLLQLKERLHGTA